MLYMGRFLWCVRYSSIKNEKQTTPHPRKLQQQNALALWNTVWQQGVMLKMGLSHEPSNLAPGAVGLYPRESFPQVLKEARIRRTSVAVFFVLMKDWKQSKSPAVGEFRNPLW